MMRPRHSEGLARRILDPNRHQGAARGGGSFASLRTRSPSIGIIFALWLACTVPLLGAAPAPQPAPPAPPAPLKIVFAAVDRIPLGDDVGLPQIYTINEDTTGVRRLTWDPTVACDWPMWVANGTKIIYTAQRGEGPDAQQGIYLMDADGSNATLLMPTRGRTIQPRISPDGRTLIFTSSWDEFPVVAIYRVDLATMLVENLSALAHPDVGLDSDPKWSADGTNIAFINGPLEDGLLQESQAYIMAANGTGRRALTSDRYWHTDPSLSPDGRYVATSVYRGADPAFIALDRGLSPRPSDWHLMVKDLLTGEERILTEGKACVLREPWEAPCSPAEAPAWVPQWSPDGRRIAFSAIRSRGLVGLYVIDADGSNARTLVEFIDKDIVWYDWTESAAPAAEAPSIGQAPQASALLYSARRLPTRLDPSGNFMYAETDEADRRALTPALYTSTEDRWRTTEIRPGDGLAPELARWTPDRSRIVFTARVSPDTAVAGARAPDEISRRSHVYYGAPSLRRDPQAQASIAEQQVFIMDAAGGVPRQLTTAWTEDLLDAIPDGELRGNTEPDVSPDGRLVVFTNLSGRTTESYILAMDLETGEVINLTSVTCGPTVCHDRSPRFSPDGQTIAFISLVQDSFQLFTMDSEGRNVRQITFDPADRLDPAWSRDGRWIAYVRRGGPVSSSGDGERWSLVKLNVETGEETELIPSGEYRSLASPTWSPEEQRLALIMWHGAQPDIYIVDANQRSAPRPAGVTAATLEAFVDWR